MEREQLDITRETKDVFNQLKSDSVNFVSSSGIAVDQESRRLFCEAKENFMSSETSMGTDLFKKLVKEREEHISDFFHTSSIDSPFDRDGGEFIRSFSAGSGWGYQQNPITPLSSPVSNICNPQASPSTSEMQLAGFSRMHHAFPRFGSFGGFPRFNPFMIPCAGGSIFNENWHSDSNTESIKMSQSTMEYSSSSYSRNSRFVQEQLTRSYQEEFDVSETESEDEDTMLALTMVQPLSIAPSESDDTSSISTNEPNTRQLLAIEASPDPRKDKAFRLALELLTTEESYVRILHLIDQIFHFRVDHENRAHSMFPQEIISQIFSNVKSIYKFHHDFLLPQLEARMTNWEQERRIGDIMKNFAPFLKMYTEYVKNFDNAMNIINSLASKHERFADIMNEIHQMPECGSLTLSHHMLSPIQRVPRYELLLKDYLKKLPEDSPDREDTEKALHLVSTAANHSNEAMKKIDKFKQLLEIQENISGVVDLVSPTRELLKEGKIIKISARSGDHQERYLFLFSDILLLCSPRRLPNRVISGPAYHLRAKFEVDGTQVLEGDNLETANTFYIRDNHKNVELYTQTLEDKTAWLDALDHAMQELYKRKSSLKIGADCATSNEMDVGKRPPNFLKMEGVTKCMNCKANFSVMRRKHHCRACGIVLCSKCSNQKFTLPFEEKASRVCHHCYQILSHKSGAPSPDKSPDGDSMGKENLNFAFNKEKGVLEVAADATCVLSGYLQLKTHKSWIRRWFSLHPDFVLYSFRSHTDQRAMTATPLPGFTIVKVSDLKGESLNPKDKIFKMYHTRKMYYFQTSTKEELEKWVHVLQLAARAELPSPEKGTR